jgi:Tfp pilus assembly protein PilX
MVLVTTAGTIGESKIRKRAMKTMNKKGVAMIVVIGIIMALLVLGAAAILISLGHFGTSYVLIRRARAFYAAEAALQHVLWQLRNGQIALPTPGNSLSVVFPNNINAIPASDIDIAIEDLNQAGESPIGVYPIHITVTY